MNSVEYFTRHPYLFGRRKQAKAGNTVFLRHKNTIRTILLTAAWNSDPLNGKMPVTSPIGRALVGRHEGDHIRLSTLDGLMEYLILKII